MGRSFVHALKSNGPAFSANRRKPCGRVPSRLKHVSQAIPQKPDDLPLCPSIFPFEKLDAIKTFSRFREAP